MIGDKELAGLASLARIKLTEAERQGLAKDISAILDYVNQLKEVKLPTAGEKVLGELKNTLRADADPHPVALYSAALLLAAASRQDDYLKVKAIFGDKNGG